ncbi:MAG: hypothetical protein EXS14_05065 [Planctomycetes bacterium]|nr:hypothetical protein [Planctomycetota bacterium]
MSLWCLVLAVGLLCVACGSSAELARATARDQFLEGHGFGSERWCSLVVKNSFVTGTSRRISFDKDAAVEALLSFRGGTGHGAAPLAWPVGTVFVAESLAVDGHALDTEILIVRGDTPDFRIFDETGAVSNTFRQPGDPPSGPRGANVPVVCSGCHNGTGFFPPMMNFPTEPEAQAVSVADGARNAVLIERFLEGFHRSGGTFGPYASMFLGQLRAGLLNGSLDAADRARAERLRMRYPEVLDVVR